MSDQHTPVTVAQEIAAYLPNPGGFVQSIASAYSDMDVVLLGMDNGQRFRLRIDEISEAEADHAERHGRDIPALPSPHDGALQVVVPTRESVRRYTAGGTEIETEAYLHGFRQALAAANAAARP